MYLAGLDIHDYLRRSPLTHAQGVEAIVWLTTFAGVYRGFRNHSKSHRHRLHAKHGLPSSHAETGISKPPGDTPNIGERPPRPLLLRILSPVVHGAIIATPTVYLIGTALGRLEQPEWFSNWSLPDTDLTVGKFAVLRTLACVANYGVLYLLKRVRKQIHAAVSPSKLSYCKFYSPVVKAASDKPTIPEQGPYSVVRHPMAA